MDTVLRSTELLAIVTYFLINRHAVTN